MTVDLSSHRWFSAKGKKAFATCPITENGSLRVVGHARATAVPGGAGALELIPTPAASDVTEG